MENILHHFTKTWITSLTEFIVTGKISKNMFTYTQMSTKKFVRLPKDVRKCVLCGQLL
jgi:hypothetical protein